MSAWDSSDLVEVRANAFASNFLMPAALLSEGDKARWLDPSEVSTWAGRLRVSVPALLSALYGERLIDATQRASLRATTRRPTDDPPDPELEGARTPAQADRWRALFERGLSKDYVHYEAVGKPRSNPSQADLALQQQFRERAEKRRGFAPVPITVEDLAAVASIPEARKLGRGEIAALALARKLRAAIMTDDQGARRAAPKAGVVGAQTTPHLLGWLLYEGALGDGDVGDVIAEHEQRVGETQGRLSKYFRRIHEEAYRCRLLRDQLRTG